jgi:chromosome partition protein MukE
MTLEDVIRDPDFPALDLALRRGRHVDRDDVAWYELLTAAQDHLEELYRRYGCELIQKPDGYFYLLPTGEQLSRRQLAPADMLVGQALALLYLDPATVERGGRVTAEELIAQLVAVLGADALVRELSPKRKRQDERVAQRIVRARIAEAARRLAGLGFVDLGDDDHLRLRTALLRFAEPVRGLAAPAEALARLVAQGEVALAAETESLGDPDAGDAAPTARGARDPDGDDDGDPDGDDDGDPDGDDDGDPDGDDDGDPAPRARG